MTAPKARKPAPPAGLAAAGKALWSAVVKDYELRPDELAVLAGACRTKDEVARLEAELTAAPTLATGSAGQTVVHPLFDAVRQHRRVLVEQLRAVGLPEDPADDADVSTLATSAAARDLAAKRWKRA